MRETARASAWPKKYLRALFKRGHFECRRSQSPSQCLRGPIPLPIWARRIEPKAETNRSGENIKVSFRRHLSTGDRGPSVNEDRRLFHNLAAYKVNIANQRASQLNIGEAIKGGLLVIGEEIPVLAVLGFPPPTRNYSSSLQTALTSPILSRETLGLVIHTNFCC